VNCSTGNSSCSTDIASECDLGDDALAALAASPHLRPRRLDLYENSFGPAGLIALAGSPVIGSVEELKLTFIRVGDPGATR
jgi:hypothetical protein